MQYQFKKGTTIGRQFQKGETAGEKNSKWKGDQASYAAKHIWVNNNFGRPQRCEHCGTTEKRMYHWANISGTYKRERSDWLRLCVPCHKGHDIKVLGGNIKARPKKQQPSKLCSRCKTEFFKKPQYSYKQWEATSFCSKVCAAKYTGTLLKGTKQSEETKALKSQKLRVRWATNDQWRANQVERMLGNRYAANK